MTEDGRVEFWCETCNNGDRASGRRGGLNRRKICNNINESQTGGKGTIDKQTNKKLFNKCAKGNEFSKQSLSFDFVRGMKPSEAFPLCLVNV